MDLRDETGAMLGRLDRIRLAGGRFEAEGWGLVNRVGLVEASAQRFTKPDLPRPDVAAALGHDETDTLGFWVDLPWGGAPVSAILETDAGRYIYALPQIRARQLRRARQRCLPGFVRAVLASLPDMGRWRLTGSLQARSRIKARLGLNDQSGPARLLDPDLFAAKQGAPGAGAPRAPAGTRITIVLPVYNAFDLLPEVLQRLVDHTDLPWHLIAVEDCSTDPDLRPWLRDWAAGQGTDRVTLLENETNQGFIRSVNRAFALARDRGDHVVLLNSDAFVPAGWAARLLGPILASSDVASVTPMSNDAEIFTAPAICARHDLIPGEADAIDAAARQRLGAEVLAEAPTGVGFCMAMNIAFLRQVPEFDTTFGQGYGEEVDWCQKTRARGGRHLGHGGVFVEHRGGQSFGSAKKQKLVAANNAVISKRYDRYDAEVQRFIRDDPMHGARLALALAWAGARAGGARVPVYLAHDMGGGATHYLERRVEQDIDSLGAAAVLRVGGQQRWQIELHAPGGITRGATSDTALMERMLALLPARNMVYSCGVGDGDAIELPQVLTRLSAGQAHDLEVLFHDFFPLSPSYTLLGRDGFFHGVPEADDPDPAHRFRRPDGSWVPLQDWRAHWGRMIEGADRVTVFSEDSRTLVETAYPAVTGSVSVVPHRLLHKVPAIPPGAGWNGRPVIGVLGNIGYQKGAAVLRDLSQDLARTKQARLVVIGNIDPAYVLSDPAVVHGDYKLEDLPGLVERYGISQWLIPSIWPETFSYATHEALATGLPVWAFDLGAHGAAVARAAAETGQGGVLALRDGEAPLKELLDQMLNLTEKPAL